MARCSPEASHARSLFREAAPARGRGGAGRSRPREAVARAFRSAVCRWGEVAQSEGRLMAKPVRGSPRPRSVTKAKRRCVVWPGRARAPGHRGRDERRRHDRRRVVFHACLEQALLPALRRVEPAAVLTMGARRRRRLGLPPGPCRARAAWRPGLRLPLSPDLLPGSRPDRAGLGQGEGGPARGGSPHRGCPACRPRPRAHHCHCACPNTRACPQLRDQAGT